MKWLERMKGDLSKRNKSKHCHFHHDHGHDIDECYDLKQQIEVLIKQGKLLRGDHKDERQLMKGKVEELVRPPFGEIKMIVGSMSIGSSSKAKKTYLWVVQNVQLSRQPPRMIKEDEPNDCTILMKMRLSSL